MNEYMTHDSISYEDDFKASLQIHNFTTFVTQS